VPTRSGPLERIVRRPAEALDLFPVDYFAPLTQSPKRVQERKHRGVRHQLPFKVLDELAVVASGYEAIRVGGCPEGYEVRRIESCLVRKNTSSGASCKHRTRRTRLGIPNFDHSGLINAGFERGEARDNLVKARDFDFMNLGSGTPSDAQVAIQGA